MTIRLTIITGIISVNQDVCPRAPGRPAGADRDSGRSVCADEDDG